MTAKCNSVTYVKRINAYRGHHAGNHQDFMYAVNKHGPLAKILAEKSAKNNVRYQHLIEEKEDYAIMKIYHAPTDTVYDVLIDLEDVEKIKSLKWHINVPQNARTLYVANDKVGKLHRFIMNVDNPSDVIDHYDRNGLNNRKDNLRITTSSINSRNMNVKSSNKLGHNGICYEPPKGTHSGRYKVSWMENGKQKTKSFSEGKYKNAFDLAVEFREQIEKENNYNSNKSKV